MDCDRASSYAKLPSRVIEVAPTGSPDAPRLQSTTALKAQYLALSYCWGSSQSYVLTTKNVEALMRKLEVEMLPRTILDAIQVTKNLGFKYLWVDALCILQDFAEEAAARDTAKELATMDQVYRNATLTIAAACAASATDGFLKDRPGSKQNRFDIPCRLDPKQFFTVHIQEHSLYDGNREPINARAWTFQEELLSSRLLNYASHTLQWQCRTLTCNLDGSYHAPSPITTLRPISMQTLLLEAPGRFHRRGQLNPDVPHSILQHWLRIVMSYATRKSSLPSDKLPALSALASSYAPTFGPEYRAGIWANSAVQQLCWRGQDTRRFFTRPPQYRAPSWSWAALDGSVYFPSFPQAHNASTSTSVCVTYQRFEIVEWYTRLKTFSLPYGEVTAGMLTVRAVLRDATFDPSSSPAIRFIQGPNPDLQVPILADAAPIQAGQGSSDTAEDNFARPVRCLALYRSFGPAFPLIGGLMLVESSAHNTLFRRIGSCSADVSAFEGFPQVTVCIV